MVGSMLEETASDKSEEDSSLKLEEGAAAAAVRTSFLRIVGRALHLRVVCGLCSWGRSESSKSSVSRSRDQVLSSTSFPRVPFHCEGWVFSSRSLLIFAGFALLTAPEGLSALEN